MLLVLLGLVLVAAKLAERAPVAGWDWWLVLLPFGLAVLWWQFADATGMTQRRAMKRDAQRQRERRKKALKALGLDARTRPGVLADQRRVKNTSAMMNLGDNQRDLPSRRGKSER